MAHTHSYEDMSRGLNYLAGFRHGGTENARTGGSALYLRAEPDGTLTLVPDPKWIQLWLSETDQIVNHDTLGSVPVREARRHDLHAQIDVWLDHLAAREPLLNLASV